jgi:hypothetical protein
MRHMIPEDLFDFVLIGAGVLILCVLFAYSPFTDKPRYPVLFGISSAALIMAVYLLAHLVWLTRGEPLSWSSCQHCQAAERAAADLEGHPAAAELGQPGRLSVYFRQAQSQDAAQCDKPNDDKLHHLSFETNGAGSLGQ